MPRATILGGGTANRGKRSNWVNGWRDLRLCVGNCGRDFSTEEGGACRFCNVRGNWTSSHCRSPSLSGPCGTVLRRRDLWSFGRSRSRADSRLRGVPLSDWEKFFNPTSDHFYCGAPFHRNVDCVRTPSFLGDCRRLVHCRHRCLLPKIRLAPDSCWPRICGSSLDWGCIHARLNCECPGWRQSPSKPTVGLRSEFRTPAGRRKVVGARTRGMVASAMGIWILGRFEWRRSLAHKRTRGSRRLTLVP